MAGHHTWLAHAEATRAAVCAGALRGERLLESLLGVPFAARDAWVDAVLGARDSLPADLPDLPPGTVPYLPCPVDEVLRALREAPVARHDVFVDLGAGLGRPALLAHLLTGARSMGIELQRHLVEQARASAAELKASGARFVEADASIADVAEGTVFFIYASFNGRNLTRVLTQLERIARQRRLVLCAVDFEVHGQSWLTPRRSSSGALVFYDSNLTAAAR